MTDVQTIAACSIATLLMLAVIITPLFQAWPQ